MRSLIPHPLVLLLSCVFAAAVLTHVVRAGEFERRDDPVTGRRAVVAGSFHPVPQNPVGPFAVLMALPQGMTEAASVIFLVFLVGGAFSVVESTGAFNQGVTWLVRALGHRTDLHRADLLRDVRRGGSGGRHVGRGHPARAGAAAPGP